MEISLVFPPSPREKGKRKRRTLHYTHTPSSRRNRAERKEKVVLSPHPSSLCRHQSAKDQGRGKEERKFTQVLRPGSQKKVQNFSPKQHSLEVSKAFSGTKNAVNGKLQVNLTRKIRF